MTATPTTFASAAHLPVAAVRSVSTLAWLGEDPATALWLGIAERADGPEALLIPVTSGSVGAPLPIAAASALPFTLLLDLARPATIDLRDAAQRTTPAAAGRPALLVRSRLASPADGQQDQLTLIALAAPPRILWQEQVSRIDSDGGGFDSLELTIGKASRGWPRLQLLQTTLPAAGADAFMPGPPLLLDYRWQGQGYQRIE